jgi:hypothetical protein
MCGLYASPQSCQTPPHFTFFSHPLAYTVLRIDKLPLEKNRMPQEQPDYASYLLRLWKSSERGSAIWRASLESTAEGRRYSFAHLEALIAFLQKRFGALRAEREASRDDQPNPTYRRNP